MDDLIELLEHTTPVVSAPNVGALRRRARVRRRRRWASVVIPLVVLAAGAVALRPATGHRVTTANAPQPVGTWRRTSPPPLDLTSQVRTVTLSDGRLLVVAGSFDGLVPAHPFETALYDAHLDRWTRLATAPVAPKIAGAELLAANDQVILLAHGDGGPVSVALLDGHTLQWRAIPIPPQSGHVFDAWAWNGTTLVLARFGLNPNAPNPGSSGQPLVERWSADTNAWRPGASPPTAPRFWATVARTPHQLAVWGGNTFDPHAPKTVPLPGAGDGSSPTTAGSGIDRPRRAFTDGAIYDIEHDSWAYLPPEPSLAEMTTRGEEALLSASTLTLLSSEVDGIPRIVARYEHGSWRRLPPPSAKGEMYHQQEAGTLAVVTVNESGPQRAQYIDGTADEWQTAPASQLAQSPHGLLAISATTDGPGNSAFSVWRLDGSTWTPATPAPFPNRMEPGVGIIGNQLLVIGGQQGPDLQSQHDAWLLDLTPTQPGSSSP
ncbi:MAG: hypothetical protein QOG50_1344 [Actinomycetota bacterium]|nr:hypothetical protein [Actinomycetota bacterium]